MNKNEKKSTVITVTSPKGGIGKTFISISMAGMFAKEGYKTLIIDTDMGSGGVSVSLNTPNEKDIYTLSEDIKNNKFDKIENYIYQYNSNLFVLPAPKDPRKNSKFNSKILNLILNSAQSIYDVIILDTTHILNNINVTALDISDTNLFVTSSDIVAVKNLKSIISILKDLDRSNYKIIKTDALYKGIHKLKDKDIKGIINEDINYTITKEMYIKNYDNYLIKGQIPILDKKYKKLYNKIRQIGLEMLNTERNK